VNVKDDHQKMIPIRHVGLYACKFQCYHQHRAFFLRVTVGCFNIEIKPRSSAIRRESAHLTWLHCTLLMVFQYETV